MRWVFFGIILFGNLWIWKILSFNLLLGIFIILASLIVYKNFNENKFSLAAFCLIIVLTFLQYKTTNITPLTQLTEQERITQIRRLNEYPAVSINLGEKKVWIPIAHWFEERNESVTFFKILNNFSEAADPNLYFFANHPRERIGFEEFEKFPYILYPVFILGLFLFFMNLKKQNITIILLSFLFPILVVSFIGNKNLFGTFSLLPFITSVTTSGLIQIHEKTNNNKLFLWVFLLIFILVFIQILAYDKY